MPLCVVGEVKSYMDDVSRDDIEHLLLLQQQLRANGCDCFMMIATFKPVLSADTIGALRDACENAPQSLGAEILPVFPIVLTEENLSAWDGHSANPTSWHHAGRGLSN